MSSASPSVSSLAAVAAAPSADQGCKALDEKGLTNGFNMNPNETAVFIEALERKADSMG
jgi:hypothetical protein